MVVVACYEAIAPVMLPHIADRPVTMERYPAGIEGTVFGTSTELLAIGLDAVTSSERWLVQAERFDAESGNALIGPGTCSTSDRDGPGVPRSPPPTTVGTTRTRALSH
jgi:hypothetical protein